MQAKTPATVNDALESFKKAIELKPDFANAYQNLVYTTIGDDSKIVADINALRKDKPDEASKLIDARRERFAKALPFAESWYKVDPKNIDAVSTLKEIYVVTKNLDKVKEMKAKEAELSASCCTSKIIILYLTIIKSRNIPVPAFVCSKNIMYYFVIHCSLFIIYCLNFIPENSL